MEWMLMPLKRYADFQGRSRRMEYWMFTLLVVIVVFVLRFSGGILGFSGGSVDPNTGQVVPGAGGFLIFALLGIFALAIFVPSLAVQVRRFHDQDKSGWFVLLALIPFVGGIIVLVFMCLPGTPGPNRFGPDPLGETGNLGQTFQ